MWWIDCCTALAFPLALGSSGSDEVFFQVMHVRAGPWAGASLMLLNRSGLLGMVSMR